MPSLMCFARPCLVDIPGRPAHFLGGGGRRRVDRRKEEGGEGLGLVGERGSDLRM